jgi:ribulose-phosphate 3-epimerase
MSVRIAPSILSADFARLADEIACIEPNLTFGTKVIETVRRLTDLPLDVHLMVVEPERYFDDFAAAGASSLTIHVEAAPHLNRQLARIKELGCLAGAALNPATSLETVRESAADLDLLLVMTVTPGFGGQEFIPGTADKVRRARALLDAARSAAVLEVDGGINRDTIADAWRAGADTFVAGHAVFGAGDPREEITVLRRMCMEHV